MFAHGSRLASACSMSCARSTLKEIEETGNASRHMGTRIKIYWNAQWQTDTTYSVLLQGFCKNIEYWITKLQTKRVEHRRINVEELQWKLIALRNCKWTVKNQLASKSKGGRADPLQNGCKQTTARAWVASEETKEGWGCSLPPLTGQTDG